MSNNNSHSHENHQQQHHSSFPAKGDPYAALSLPNFATPSEIKKQFRLLSLKYHPDKRSSDLTPAQKEEYDRQFLNVQEARDFLLNDDYKKQKREYDEKLRSEALRKEEEDRREQAMSSKRKKMKHDLEEKIRKLSKGREPTDSGRETHHVRTGDRDAAAHKYYEDLKQEGMRRRQEYGSSQSAMEEKLRARENKKEKDDLQSRQVRIKWSRKKLGGPSEDMLAKLLSRFGQVESVELIGNKGNSALITFQNASSCEPCVEFYKDSDELRANYIGKRRREDENLQDDRGEEAVRLPLHRDRDRESVLERKLRQAAERERLLRKIEMGGDDCMDDIDHGGGNDDEQDGTFVTKGKRGAMSSSSGKGTTAASVSVSAPLFPPPFPPSVSFAEDGTVLSSLQKLHKMEKKLLKDFLTNDEMAEMHVMK